MNLAQAAAEAPTDWGTLLVTVLISSGFTGLMATVIAGFINRRNLNADTAQKISGAASTILEKFDRDNERLREAEQRLEGRVRRLSNTVRVIGNDALDTLEMLEDQGHDVTEKRAALQEAMREVEED